tara:strand:- start:194 stop:1075 length:882 start_codon:yes stop_codon:yes gene_type:complete
MFNHEAIDFSVSKFPLINVPTDVGVGLMRNDTRETLAIVSEHYHPTQYLEITDAVEESLRQSGLDLTDAQFETNVYDKGARLELVAKFPAHPMKISEGDVVVPELRFRTSQNQTWANNGYVGAFRSLCYNSLVSGNVLAYVYGKHTKNFSVPQFAAKIRTAAEYIAGDGMNQMQRWCDTPINRDTAIDLFTETLAHRQDNVKREQVANKKKLSNLMKIFDEENRYLLGQGRYEKYAQRNEGTLWTAYQAATYWSSHPEYGGKEGSKAHTTKVTREDQVKKMLNHKMWKELEVC